MISNKFLPVSEVFVDGVEFRLPYVSKQKREKILKEEHVSIDAVIKSATKHIQVHNVLPKWNQCTQWVTFNYSTHKLTTGLLGDIERIRDAIAEHVRDAWKLSTD